MIVVLCDDLLPAVLPCVQAYECLLYDKDGKIVGLKDPDDNIFKDPQGVYDRCKKSPATKPTGAVTGSLPQRKGGGFSCIVCALCSFCSLGPTLSSGQGSKWW